MPDRLRLPAPLHFFPSVLHERIRAYVTLPTNHPVKVSSRTYGLALFLSLGPALLPFVTKTMTLVKAGKDADRMRAAKAVTGLGRLLRRELGPFGFAFAVTTAVAGGLSLQNLLENLEKSSGLSLRNGVPIFGAARDLKAMFSNVKSTLGRHLASLSDAQRAFLANFLASSIAISLLQWKRAPRRPSGVPELPLTLPIDDIPKRNGISPTLNLTLILFVRALDSVVYGGLRDELLRKLKGKGREVTPGRTEVEGAQRDSVHAKNRIRRRISILDSLVFCVCSARIIWCFFYKPKMCVLSFWLFGVTGLILIGALLPRLPNAYVKWISRLAEIDPRIIWALQSIHHRSLSYHRLDLSSLDLVEFAKGLGYPASWGDLSAVPAYGTDATPVWRKLGVRGRDGIGGIPCELVHGGNGAGNSCTKNIIIRGRKAWLSALLIYLPAHLVPVAIKRPRDLISFEKLIPVLLGVVRSATFLSAFVQLMWFGVCSARTFLFARLFPWISHDYFDGPYGCVFVASLICGSSIWIENSRRRGEIALYVLPRAIRTILSDSWLKSGRRRVQLIERIVFVTSLSTLLTSAVHKPESLRGLSKWVLNYVFKGSDSLAKK